MDNLYQLLGVPHFAEFEEIQKAYSKLYGELFVSENPLGNIPKLKELKDAFELLSDPVRRADYDSRLKSFLDELEKQYGDAVDALTRGEYDSSIAMLKDCIKANPREPDFYETLGLAYQLSDQPEEASRSFQQGLSLGKKNALFNWYLGDLFRVMREDEKADTHYLDAAEGFKEILKVDPRNLEAQEMLADTYAKMKWYEESLEMYQKLIEQFPYKAEYQRQIGAVYYELEMLDEAQEHLDEALRNAPDDPSVFLFLGLVFFKRRLLTKAIDYLEESLRQRAAQPEVIKLLEKIREIKKDVGQTIEEMIQDPHPDAVVEGTIKWYNPETGIGVVSSPEYPEVLLHYSALAPGDRENIEKGAAVRFGVVKDKVGPVAVQVERIDQSQGSDTLPGVIERFDDARKIGSIRSADGKDVMFHFSALSPELTDHLEVGLNVLYEIKSTKGLSDHLIEQAINIRPRKKPKKKA